jgi:hypothetical protein
MEADNNTDSMPSLELATDVIGSPMSTLQSLTKILSGTSPMPLMVPDNPSMTPMPTNLINFADNTEELGNSSTKAVLSTHLFPFF